MTCKGCADPYGGIYIAGCRACSLRDIGRSPCYFASMVLRKLTPGYQALLAQYGAPHEVHKEVRAMADALEAGAEPTPRAI